MDYVCLPHELVGEDALCLGVEKHLTQAPVTTLSYSELPNYDVILPVLLKYGVEELPNHCKLTPGRVTCTKYGSSSRDSARCAVPLLWYNVIMLAWIDSRDRIDGSSKCTSLYSV